MSKDLWQATKNPVLEERRIQLYDRYRGVSRALTLLNKQMDEINEALKLNGHSVKCDELEQLNEEFGLSLKIGQTYLITDDLMPKYDTGYLGFPQPVVCSHITYFDTVMFHGNYKRWIALSASQLQDIQAVNVVIEDVLTKYGYASYLCSVCREYEPIREMEIINEEFVCNCVKASQDD